MRGREEKSPVVSDRAVKVWERMPERRYLNGGTSIFVQVRKDHGLLRSMQVMF